MSTAKFASLNSGGQYEYGEWIPITYCECDQQLKLLTTWKAENSGRRFWKCIGSQPCKGCGMMEWFDPPMCKRSQKIILGLLKKMNGYEEKIRTLEMKLETLEVEGFKPEKKRQECSEYSRALVCIVAVLVVFVSMYIKAT
ncbi:unnamed protein product [Cuscuta epithymum]|uniref:GRF-type domain-containing protein n=1 Tax=Cuscuta epithymum TaxID=186058 RepID=A0AAV0G331_9ASTE|nr:unnamed protein product [Cuscuta epithymum]